MRRSFHLNRSKASEQQGFVLFIVLMMMIVIAFLAVATTQSYNTEMRIGSNDSDRKLAMSLAEAALRQGESDITNFNNPTFSQNCLNGLCAAVGVVAENENDEGVIVEENLTNTVVAWERTCGNDLCLETNGRTYTVGNNTNISRAPRYIIEYINANSSIVSDAVATTYYYRVTARAWGRNANTVVTVQSYVEVVKGLGSGE